MRRSSRLIHFLCGLALCSTAAGAQVYGFPGEVGVVDDGFGTLPPETPSPLPPPDFLPPPPAPTAIPAPRPVCALIIQVGAGLRHRAATRVVYGRTPRCR